MSTSVSSSISSNKRSQDDSTSLAANKRVRVTANMSSTASASWVQYEPETCDFPIQHLPYGIFSTAGSEPRVGVAIGEF